MEEVTEFTIDRAIWLRGEGGGRSYLLRSTDQKECCLGIYLEACGVPREHLEGASSPQMLRRRYSAVPAWLTGVGVSGHLMLDNDKPRLDESEREARIAAGFAKQ